MSSGLRSWLWRAVQLDSQIPHERPAGEGLPVHVGYDTARLRQPSTRSARGLGEAVRIDLSCRLPTRPESPPGPSPLWSDGSVRGDDLVRNQTEEVSP